MIDVVTGPERTALAGPVTVDTTSVSVKVQIAERHKNVVRKLQRTTYKVINSSKLIEKMRRAISRVSAYQSYRRDVCIPLTQEGIWLRGRRGRNTEARNMVVGSVHT